MTATTRTSGPVLKNVHTHRKLAVSPFCLGTDNMRPVSYLKPTDLRWTCILAKPVDETTSRVHRTLEITIQLPDEQCEVIHWDLWFQGSELVDSSGTYQLTKIAKNCIKLAGYSTP